MHTNTQCKECISNVTFSSLTHNVAFNRECIAVGHKPEALGSDRELCVWDFRTEMSEDFF